MEGSSPVLTFEGVSFSYGSARGRGGKRPTVLRDVSFSAYPGTCVVIAGTNGSGKSTLLSLAAGIRKASAGCVKRSGAVGYVPQGSALLEDATVSENLRFFADLVHAEIPDPLPFAVGGWLDRKVARLSGGMKKQVSIACAMAGDPDVLLFDEPCGALDIRFRDALASLILDRKRAGKTVLYVGHDPSEFYPFCDRLLFLRPGGGAEEITPLPGDESAFRALYVSLLNRTEDIYT